VRGGNSTSDNHCAINRSIDVQRHGVNQFLASRIQTAHSSKLVGAFVKAIFVIALSVRPMMWLAA
jgi:hypothetical protein